MKITKEQLLKLQKKINREISLQLPFIRGGAHKTSKKDRGEKKKNTIDLREIHD